MSTWEIGRGRALSAAEKNFPVLHADTARNRLDFAARTGEETLPDGADRVALRRRNCRRDARKYLALAFLVGARNALAVFQLADAVGDGKAPLERGENRVVRRVDFIPQLVQLAHLSSALIDNSALSSFV